MNEDSFNDFLDIVFFVIESDFVLKYVKIVSFKKIYVVDNFLVYCMIEYILLVVFEVNSYVLKFSDYIVVNLNCFII